MNGIDLERFFYLSPDLLAVLDKDFYFAKVNDSYERILGYSQKHLDGRKVFDIVYEEDRRSVVAKFESMVGQVQDVTFENRLVGKGGDVFWFSWIVKKSADGAAYYCYAEDVTSERETQRKLLVQNTRLAESEAKDEAMLQNIGDGVIGVNDGGEILFVNARAQDMLGYSQEGLKGKQVIHAIALLDEEGGEVSVNDRPIHVALFDGKDVINNQDYSYKRRDGTTFPASITASPVRLRERLIGGVLVFRDITREKEVDRMKTEFISLASHQLRTPLSAMKWFSELLIGGDVGELTEEQRRVIENIYQSNERMIDLVNSLLNISRIESGRLVIDPELTDLKKLVDEVVVELEQRVVEKKLKLAVSAHEGLPKISIDPKLVRHVYMNLLTNAVKYTPEGGEIVITISRKGQEVLSQVSDSGYGIPKSQQSEVFKKFFRGENILKVETDGTGLGLYLTKAIMEASGGKIWFKSEEGKGSTFWFSLPMAGTPPKEGEVTIDS